MRAQAPHSNELEQRLDMIAEQLSLLAATRQIKNPVFTIEQVAQQFSVTRPTVYKWIGKGWLASLKVGGRRRVTAKAIERFKTEAEKASEIR
ncbi:helix-turn-helix domain-containing protein [Pseudomonadota bacterium]